LNYNTTYFNNLSGNSPRAVAIFSSCKRVIFFLPFSMALIYPLSILSIRQTSPWVIFFLILNFLMFSPSFFTIDISTVYKNLHYCTILNLIQYGDVRPEFQKRNVGANPARIPPQTPLAGGKTAEAGRILFLQKLYTFHILSTKCSRSCESVPHFLTPKNSFAKTSSVLFQISSSGFINHRHCVPMHFFAGNLISF